jgi:arsenite methyltransferase
VVTTRSVLIYVKDKRRAAFEELHRVLKPGGRLSIFEPINNFTYPEPPHLFGGSDVTPVALTLLRG